MSINKWFVGMMAGWMVYWLIGRVRQRAEQAGQVDRRSKGWLSYYYSAMIPLAVEDFAALALIAALAAGVIGTKLLGHWILGMLSGGILLAVVAQAVWMRSMEHNHNIDLELPHFFGLIRNTFLATNGNERFALEYAAEHITLPALKKPFSVLSERWANGAELHAEAERTKRFFRNPTVWHLLDALQQEHYGGGSFLRDLDRLTEQARERFRLAETRKVATAGSVYALYGILLLNLFIVLLLVLIDPQGMAAFRDMTAGKWITGLSLIGYAGILFVSFRLIRLGDD